MPFAVFRRYQKSLLAVLALFAMVAFTLDFSLFRNRGFGGPDAAVVELYGRTIRRSNLDEMRAQRSRANRFMARISGAPDQPYFGGMNERAIIDALILQHKADELGIPVDAELARRWCVFRTNNMLTSDLFEKIYRENFGEEVTGEQLLADIANQIRLADVQGLPGLPQVTPLDVYQAYRDQYERVSASAVPFAVEDYIAKVPDPTDAELASFFEKYKTALPDRTRDTPGFTEPRRVQVEHVSIDGDALAKQIKSKLTDAELREVYKNRSSEFLTDFGKLPQALFAGDPTAKLTPKLNDEFPEVKPQVAARVAEERAQDEVSRKFGAIRDEVMAPFSEKYTDVAAENTDLKAQGKPAKPLPSAGGLLKGAADREHLAYERTPTLDREEAQRFGRISGARQGTGPSLDGRSFADAFFDPRGTLYEEFEFTDDLNRRYLAWKTKDEPSRVPALEEVRPRVIHAWKMEKARSLAEKDALAFADQVRDAKGNLKAVAGKRVVLTTDPVSRLTPASMLDRSRMSPPRPSEIARIPDAGEGLRNALFNLGPKSVAVEPNAPKTVYYVMTLNETFPVDFSLLYSPFGPKTSLQSEVIYDAMRRRAEAWMNSLRVEAGLKPDWKPADESRNELASAG